MGIIFYGGLLSTGHYFAAAFQREGLRPNKLTKTVEGCCSNTIIYNSTTMSLLYRANINGVFVEQEKGIGKVSYWNIHEEFPGIHLNLRRCEPVLSSFRGTNFDGNRFKTEP